MAMVAHLRTPSEHPGQAMPCIQSHFAPTARLILNPSRQPKGFPLDDETDGKRERSLMNLNTKLASLAPIVVWTIQGLAQTNIMTVTLPPWTTVP